MGLLFQSVITSDRFGWTIRGIQFVFTVINLGLSANSIKIYNTEVSYGGSLLYFLALSILTMIYLFILAILSFFFRQNIITGSIIIVESIFIVLWFSAFVPVAVDYGNMNCSYYNLIYSLSESICGTIKTSVAFGLFDFLLFSLTTVIFGLNVIRPLVTERADIWSPVKNTNYKLNGSIISLKETDSYNVKRNDVETDVSNKESKAAI